MRVCVWKRGGESEYESVYVCECGGGKWLSLRVSECVSECVGVRV